MSFYCLFSLIEKFDIPNRYKICTLVIKNSKPEIGVSLSLEFWGKISLYIYLK